MNHPGKHWKYWLFHLVLFRILSHRSGNSIWSTVNPSVPGVLLFYYYCARWWRVCLSDINTLLLFRAAKQPFHGWTSAGQSASAAGAYKGVAFVPEALQEYSYCLTAFAAFKVEQYRKHKKRVVWASKCLENCWWPCNTNGNYLFYTLDKCICIKWIVLEMAENAQRNIALSFKM